MPWFSSGQTVSEGGLSVTPLDQYKLRTNLHLNMTFGYFPMSADSLDDLLIRISSCLFCVDQSQSSTLRH